MSLNRFSILYFRIPLVEWKSVSQPWEDRGPPVNYRNGIRYEPPYERIERRRPIILEEAIWKLRGWGGVGGSRG